MTPWGLKTGGFWHPMTSHGALGWEETNHLFFNTPHVIFVAFLLSTCMGLSQCQLGVKSTPNTVGRVGRDGVLYTFSCQLLEVVDVLLFVVRCIELTRVPQALVNHGDGVATDYFFCGISWWWWEDWSLNVNLQKTWRKSNLITMLTTIHHCLDNVQCFFLWKLASYC